MNIMSLEDLTRYQGAGLAASLARSEEGQRYLSGALEQLAEDMGVSESARGFIDGALSSDEGIKAVLGSYGQKYQESKNSLNVGELFSSYEDVLNSYLENQEDSAKIMGEVNKYSEENYGNIMKKIFSAKHVIDGEGKYDFSNDEKESAKRTIEQYGNLVEILGTLESARFESLRLKAVEKTNKLKFKQIASKL